MNYDRLRKSLHHHEGYREYPYVCTAGKITIGVGHNLTDNGLPAEVIQLLFKLDVDDCIKTCRALFGAWHDINDTRQMVLANMAFQLGYDRLGGFVKLITAVNAKDWVEATRQMLDSRWARQVPGRAQELAAIMRG